MADRFDEEASEIVGHWFANGPAEMERHYRASTQGSLARGIAAALRAEGEPVARLREAIEELLAHGVEPHVEAGLREVLAATERKP